MKHIKLFENWQEDEDNMQTGSTLVYDPAYNDAMPVSEEEAVASIVDAFTAKSQGGRSKSILLTGAPGMGKEAVAKKAADEIGVEPLMIDAASMSPDDFEGTAYAKDGETSMSIPDWFPTEGPGILVLSDINRAPNKVLYSALSLAQGGTMGGLKLPTGWLVVAIMDTDGKPLSAALADRFQVLNLG